MGVQNQQSKRGWTVGTTDGFTIIEVILFLAISALLAATLLGGWTLTINTQRYKDSNKTLQSFLQEQYNLVYNVENGRDANLACTLSGTELSIHPVPLSNTPPGQSDCVVMGRYIHVQNGTTLNVSTIVGLDQTPDSSQSDLQQMLAFKVQKVDEVTGLTRSSLTIPWQATIVGQNGDPTARGYNIAIIRAPSSGIVHTFTQETSAQLPVSQLVLTANERNPVYFCLDPGVTVTGPRTGVMIEALASAQSSVKVIPPTGAPSC
jgi:type II secretory pathway pseudopilin PulG